MATNRLVQKGKVQVYSQTLFDAANDAGSQDSVVEVRNQLAQLLKLVYSDMDVTTVVPLDDELRKLIKEKTEADLGCKAVLNESIDKTILGGIIMSVNGMRIDASVISQLNKARHTLKENDGGEN